MLNLLIFLVGEPSGGSAARCGKIHRFDAKIPSCAGGFAAGCRKIPWLFNKIPSCAAASPPGWRNPQGVP